MMDVHFHMNNRIVISDNNKTIGIENQIQLRLYNLDYYSYYSSLDLYYYNNNQ